MNKKALWETFKFVARIVILVGIPAVVAELAKQKPEWGGAIGVVLVVIDKLIHEAPVKATGIVPF